MPRPNRLIYRNYLEDQMHYSELMIPHNVVDSIVEEFLQHGRHPEQPPAIRSTMLDLEFETASLDDGPGVYLMYRRDKTLIYIGMSLSNVSSRISKHLSSREQQSEFWRDKPPAFVQTVTLPVENAWEAPSFEEFLVKEAKKLITPPIT